MIRAKKHRTLRGMAAVLALLAFVVTMVSVSPAAWAGKKDPRDEPNRAGGDSDGITGNRYQNYEYTIDLPGGGGAGTGAGTGESLGAQDNAPTSRPFVVWISRLFWIFMR